MLPTIDITTLLKHTRPLFVQSFFVFSNVQHAFLALHTGGSLIAPHIHCHYSQWYLLCDFPGLGRRGLDHPQCNGLPGRHHPRSLPSQEYPDRTSPLYVPVWWISTHGCSLISRGNVHEPPRCRIRGPSRLLGSISLRPGPLLWIHHNNSIPSPVERQLATLIQPRAQRHAREPQASSHPAASLRSL